MKNKLGTYFQPDIDDFGEVKGHPKEEIPTFCVWHKKEHLMEDYPNCTPIEYSGDDIEEPTFMD